MNSQIKAVSASAGSGKTYSLTQTLLEKIKSRELSPENLVAVTFTEAGASELKGRIRAVLLKEGLFEEAQQVEEAYISTIHAFGFRLLKELAFDLGLPLSSRMLNEDEQTQLIRTSMVGSEALTDMSNALETFGYKTRMKGKKFVSAEAVFREHLQQFIDLLRSTGRHSAETEFLNRSVQWIEKQYGTVDRERSPQDMAKSVHSCVLALLKEFPDCPIEIFQITAESARKAFQQSYRALERATQLEALLTDWALWAELSAIKITFKGSKDKPGYERYAKLATSLKQTVDAHFAVHPGPLAHASRHLEGLLKGASETLAGYSDRKKKSALLDFTDMVAHAEQALRNTESRQRLLDCIRMVVVDEFQDTNPIQFAFLWHLIGSGVPSILVGDVKQSIMGFQGADPRLFEALIRNPDVSVSSLESNWRSQPKLMEVINALTLGLAGEKGMDANYHPLEAKGKPSPLKPLHVVEFRQKPDQNKKKEGEDDDVIHPSELVWRASNMAEVLKHKLQSGLKAIDRRTGLPRALKGGDIAVLCPTNGMLAVYAREFEKVGLSVNLQRQDWFDTDEVQLAIQVLALIANPSDKHAQLMIATSDLECMRLEGAVSALLGEGLLHLPIFRTIDSLRKSTATLLMKDVVEAMLEESGLTNLASRWPDHAQARANLFKLIGLAREFSDAHAETLAAAGFHGKSIGTFIGWLHFLKAQRKDDLCPRANYNDEHAIELTTWHKSKGREWPIVVVAGMDKSPTVGVPDASIGYLDFNDFDSIIENSQIEFSPDYGFDAKREALLEVLRLEANQVSLRELYVALSRPRDQLVLEWLPYHLSSKSKSKRRIQLLAQLTDFKVIEQSVFISGQEFEAIVDVLNYSPMRIVEPVIQSRPPAKAHGRLAIETRAVQEERFRAQVSPSLLQAGDSPAVPCKVSTISQPIEFATGSPLNKLGTAIHRVLEIALAGHALHLKSPVVQAAMQAEGLSTENLDQLQELAKQIRRHFEKGPGSAQIYVEQVVMGRDGTRGEVVVGQVDCLVKTAEGAVVIDHKSGALTKDAESAWQSHSAQLRVYGRLFGDAVYGLVRVRAGAIHTMKFLLNGTQH